METGNAIKDTVPEKSPFFRRMEVFLVFHVICAVLSLGALFHLVTTSPYHETPIPGSSIEPTLGITPKPTSEASTDATEQPAPNEVVSSTSEQTDVSNTGQAAPSMTDFLRAMLFTTMAAGATGGTLCNLRGIFFQYENEYNLQRKSEKQSQPSDQTQTQSKTTNQTDKQKPARIENKHPFPDSLFIPFYIRPPMGIFTGLFSFLLGSLLIEALDASNLGWLTLSGRLPYIAIALLSGFASQQFMEKLKDIANTTFGQEDADKPD